MSNPIVKDFLTATTDSIRHSIKDIDDSYNNYWDIFAELAQNAVDAIHERGEKGKIDITVDCRARNIKFKDNGCGIAQDRLPELLNLFASGKADNADTIGEKGVGLKFVLFQSSKFIITTSDGNTSTRATVTDANTWKKQSGGDVIQLEQESIPIPDNPGTLVEVYGVEPAHDEDVFSLTVNQFIFMLRTKTALGNTSAIWDSSRNDIDIHLDYIDINGENTSSEIENLFYLPTEGVNDADVITIESFNAWNSSDKDDIQKRNYLSNRILVDDGSLTHNGRTLRYWACFVPSRGVWEQLNLQAKVATKEELDDSVWCNLWDSLLFKGEITVATKGMPTAITIAPPPVGNAGYLPNFFIIFEDNRLSFDIGRKSFKGRTSTIYKEEAKKVFNKFARLAKYSAGQLPPQPSSFNREEVLDQIKGYPDLQSDKVSFQKIPNGQEASVIAIFFELVGKGEIDDIVPMYMGYQNRYDLYARFNNRTIIVEFKSYLRNLIKDFSDFRKIFDEMDYVVCWEVTDEDIAKLKEEGIEVEPYVPSSWDDGVYLPKCVTHRLYISNVNPVYVIDVKQLV